MRKLHILPSRSRLLVGAVALMSIMLGYAVYASSVYRADRNKRRPEPSGGSNQVSSRQLEIIGALTSRALSANHYRKLPQNSTFSSRVFDEYLDMLDPGKNYFTRVDIAVFEKDRFHIVNQLNNGRLDTIFAIYQRYMERLQEYRAFAEAEMKKGFDFTVDENYQPDRKKAAYCLTNRQLHELWRKRLKNDILYYRLMQKVMQEQSNDPQVAAELKKRWNLKSPEDKVRTRLHDLYNHAAQMDKNDIFGIFLTALAQVYGPHSHYSTPKQQEDFDIQFKLSLTGIGATLTSEDGYTKIVDLVPGGPADKDGRLQPEDRIIAVAQDGQEPLDIIDMSVSNVVKHVRGPAGTKVTLTVLPAAKGAAAMPVDYTITRGKVELKESAAQGRIETVTAPNNKTQRIGVIKLNNFYMDFDGAARGLPDYRSCSRDVKRILEDFKSQKVDAVLLDLRSNSGGSLVEAINLSGLFITKGPIVQVVDASRNLEVQHDLDSSISYTGKLVVLVSKFSASSTEILTGAMKDYRRALVLGDSRTYGKGTVLGVVDLTRMLRFANLDFPAGSITHEVAMFYRINGDSNQVKGIPADIRIPSFTEEMEVGEVFSDNHLPWDRIAPVFDANLLKYPRYKLLTPQMVKALGENSARRFKTDTKRIKFQSDIQRFKKVRERRLVSLNEAKRLKEYYDEKAAADRTEAMLDQDSSNDKKKNKKSQDTVLQEALTITAEYAQM